MRRGTAIALGLTTLLLLAGCDHMAMSTHRAAIPAHRVVDTPLGPVLATNRGITLYTFANDTMPGMATCTAACSTNWPPLVALNDAVPTGKWSVAQRPDGLKQWAYDGKPLYGWHEDKKAGDTMGEGKLNGVWRVARP